MSKRIAIILLIGVVLRVACIFGFPMNSAPDEPAHINYVRTFANFELPIYDQKMFQYPNTIDGASSDPSIMGDRLDEVPTWENFQAPLYYLTSVPFYWLGGAYGIRLFGVIIYLVTALIILRIPFTCASVSEISLALFSFIPGVIQVHSAVGNEGFAIMMCTFTLFFAYRNRPITAGLFAGLAVLSKVSAVSMFVTAFLWIWMFYRKSTIKYLALSLPLIALYKWYSIITTNGGTIIEQSVWSSWGVALKNVPYIWDSFFMGIGYHYKLVVPPFTTFYFVLFVVSVFAFLRKPLGREYIPGLVGVLIVFGIALFSHLYMGMGYGRYMYPMLPFILTVVSLGVVYLELSRKFVWTLSGVGTLSVVCSIVLSNHYWSH